MGYYTHKLCHSLVLSMVQTMKEEEDFKQVRWRHDIDRSLEV